MYHAEPRVGAVLGPGALLRRLPALPEALLRAADGVFPVRLTRSWLARMGAAVDGPLGVQALPRQDELETHPGDVPDPVGESLRRPVPWVVQKHPDRVLLLVTRRCHLYCRYCFRRDQHDSDEPGAEALARALAYARDSGAREAILSGGDPLTLSDGRLFGIIDALRPAVPVVRVHTRAPITAPHRVTAALVEGLRARGPVWVLVHANHPDELSADVREALARLVDAGLPVLNQAVLLKGVNDDVDVLEGLSDALLSLRVFPYYLHHTDAVPGNAAFRVDVDRGLALHAELARRVSGIGLPRYVIDPPDGSGKVDVATWAARRAEHPVPSAPQED
jgi:lysine 2,3-aminomutase